ncbi:hypothetical protein [Pseudomonas protegens]|uniref:hypothetical protein n=1 Tax=Pseudomonas protegens TaxID=380021 RepID=UPI003EBFBA11
MSQKPLCDCNQGRLPCTCNTQRPVAQQQQDQNAARQRIAVLENAYIRAGEREHELRVKLHAAKQKLAEMDALFGAYGDTLRPFLALMVRELKANSHKGNRDGWLGMTAATAFNEITHHHDKLGEALSALDYPQLSEYAADAANCCMMLLDVMGLLSANAEPGAPADPVDAALDRISVKLDRAIELCEASIEKATRNAEPVVSPGDEEFSHLSTIELRGYHKGWAAASATQLAEIKRLKGLQPEAPPRPPEGDGLPRYGLRWNGPQQPLATPMDDGYWTPWHLANELRKDGERYRWLRYRDLETINQGGVFAGITPQNMVLNEETLDEAIDAAMAKEVQP